MGNKAEEGVENKGEEEVDTLDKVVRGDFCKKFALEWKLNEEIKTVRVFPTKMCYSKSWYSEIKSVQIVSDYGSQTREAE